MTKRGYQTRDCLALGRGWLDAMDGCIGVSYNLTFALKGRV